MAIFNFGKKKINSLTMMHLIYETAKSYATDIFELLDKVGIIYDETNVQINVIAINYELCRHELYKGNKHDIVDSVMDSVYKYFFYNMQTSEERLDEYKKIMENVTKKLKSILSVNKLLAPKETFVYRLLLEQMNVNEKIIEPMYIGEFLNYAKVWIGNAIAINKTYLIEDTLEDKKKNEYIDFRF